jgi:hypothetical protein
MSAEAEEKLVAGSEAVELAIAERAALDAAACEALDATRDAACKDRLTKVFGRRAERVESWERRTGEERRSERRIDDEPEIEETEIEAYDSEDDKEKDEVVLMLNA